MEHHHLNGEATKHKPDKGLTTPNESDEVSKHARFALLRLVALMGILGTAVIGKNAADMSQGKVDMQKPAMKAPDTQEEGGKNFMEGIAPEWVNMDEKRAKTDAQYRQSWIQYHKREIEKLESDKSKSPALKKILKESSEEWIRLLEG